MDKFNIRSEPVIQSIQQLKQALIKKYKDTTNDQNRIDYFEFILEKEDGIYTKKAWDKLTGNTRSGTKASLEDVFNSLITELNEPKKDTSISSNHTTVPEEMNDDPYLQHYTNVIRQNFATMPQNQQLVLVYFFQKFMQHAIAGHNITKNIDIPTAANISIELQEELRKLGVSTKDASNIKNTASGIFWSENSNWRNKGVPAITEGQGAMPNINSRENNQRELSVIGEMSQAHEVTYLLLYQKIKGINTDTFDQDRRRAAIDEMKERVKAWKPWNRSKTFARFVIQHGIPAGATWLAASLVPAATNGVVKHSFAAILAYILSAGGVNGLLKRITQDDLLMKAAQRTMDDFKKDIYIKRTAFTTIARAREAIWGLRCNSGVDPKKTRSETIDLAELRKNFDNHHSAISDTEKFWTTVTKTGLGAAFAYYGHLNLLNLTNIDSWTSMFQQWLSNPGTIDIPDMADGPELIPQDPQTPDTAINSQPIDTTTCEPNCDSRIIGTQYNYDGTVTQVAGPSVIDALGQINDAQARFSE